jgi:hypothetical protein
LLITKMLRVPYVEHRMQGLALFAVLLSERPYINPYIADGPNQERRASRGEAYTTKALYTGSIRRIAQSRDRGRDRRR